MAARLNIALTQTRRNFTYGNQSDSQLPAEPVGTHRSGLRTDFNADNAKLDAALAEKAEVETVSALQTAVASKAEQTALAALAARVTALEARPYIVTGTYTGDGTASQFIFLGFTPKALLVVGAWSAMSRDNSYYGGLALEETQQGTRRK